MLDAPVIDWGDVLAHHARLHKVPAPLGGVEPVADGPPARPGGSWASTSPLDVAKTNWVERAAELRHPMLLIHSVDDEFVPVGPSAAAGGRAPDLVTMERWDTARHTKEWNVDPDRWERSVAAFVRA